MPSVLRMTAETSSGSEITPRLTKTRFTRTKALSQSVYS